MLIALAADLHSKTRTACSAIGIELMKNEAQSALHTVLGHMSGHFERYCAGLMKDVLDWLSVASLELSKLVLLQLF